MRRYQRSMWFDQTGFAWVAPSPNLRKLEQAVLYPGVGMAEAANISVGRGTDSPFELVGAPWIDGKSTSRPVERPPAFRACASSPRPSRPANGSIPARAVAASASPSPTATASTRPLFGIELISALYRLYGDRFQIDRTVSMIGSRASLDGDQGADRPARHRPAPGRPASTTSACGGEVSAVLTAARIEASSSQ